MIYQGKARYPVHEACLHTAAVTGGWHEGKTHQEILDAFWRWHVDERGWRKVGYHRIALPDGTILFNTKYLRSIYEIPAQVKGHNRGVIGICMININTHNGITRFDDYFTEEQGDAVRGYLQELGEMTDLQKVTGHNDYAPKECPGFKVHTEDWI